MASLIFHPDKIRDIKQFLELCPFDAMDHSVSKEGMHSITANAACKMCGICLKKAPAGAVEKAEDSEEERLKPAIDKSLYKGIAVYVEHRNGRIHPITLELLGKARELADKINHPVFALFIGSEISKKSQALLSYGADTVYVYDNPGLAQFRIEPYTAVFEEFCQTARPSSILVGATPAGRQLAPRTAARLRTGLTADCTVLDIKENSDLVQIRPAFGGNIMAEIITPNTRPQMATVRYKVMNMPEKTENPSGTVTHCPVGENLLNSMISITGSEEKPSGETIESAEILIAAGRGVKKEQDLKLLRELALLLGGQLACTRPLAEAGWMDPKCQIGLSGRTVRPKLIITCGISGSVQFAAGMNGAETIIAINSDKKAPIFKTAHVGLVGDLYQVVPKLIEKIRNKGGQFHGL